MPNDGVGLDSIFWERLINEHALELHQLHRPMSASRGVVICTQGCQKVKDGINEVMIWPCPTAQMALKLLEAVQHNLRQENTLGIVPEL